MGQKWLLKSEPNVWSIDQQIKIGSKGTNWDGVRNYQARNNLTKMKVGDLCFFYHSNIGKEIVGIVKVINNPYSDPKKDDKRFVVFDIKPVKKLNRPVSLKEIKSNKIFKEFDLVRIPRLSVMPVTKKYWDTIIKLSNKQHDF